MSSSNVPQRNSLSTETSRGPVLLALAGAPEPAVLTTMTACAENLGRSLEMTMTGEEPGGVLASEADVAHVVTAVRRFAAAIVVVAGTTPASMVRRLVAETRRPVLVARTGQRWATVLSATDLRARGLPVLAAGSALAASCGARSLVMHNAPPTWAAPARLVRPTAAAVAARRLGRLARIAARTVPRSGVMVVCDRDTHRAVVEVVGARGADVVVVGMRRSTRHADGGCAEGIVTGTTANVLVVPLSRPRSATWMEVQS